MVPAIFSGIAQRQGQRLLVGMGLRAKRSAKLLGAAAVISLLASPIAFANDLGNSQQAARVEHACSVVMGLHRPGDLYDTCIRSLNNTLAGLDQARLASTDESRCARQGLKAGTSAYAVCVVDAEQSLMEATVPVE